MSSITETRSTPTCCLSWLCDSTLMSLLDDDDDDDDGKSELSASCFIIIGAI